MTPKPSISVIIPTYNCVSYIAEAIQSVLDQTLRPRQIIVVDDGSTDDTQDRIKAYSAQAVEYVRQENRGVSAARNAGIALASGGLIAFLDADDVWHPRKLELQCAALEKCPHLSMVGTETFPWPGAMPDQLGVGDDVVKEVSWSDLVVKNRFVASSVVIRRSAVATLAPDPFDMTLQGPEDYDLWLRIARQAPGGNLSLPLTGYRSSVSGLGSQAGKMEAGIRRILQKLEERRAWRGRWGWLLRRKAYAHMYCSCGYLHDIAGRHSVAVGKAARSLLTYPLPFSPDDVRTRFARPKLLALSTLRLLRFKGPSPPIS